MICLTPQNSSTDDWMSFLVKRFLAHDPVSLKNGIGTHDFLWMSFPVSEIFQKFANKGRPVGLKGEGV